MVTAHDHEPNASHMLPLEADDGYIRCELGHSAREIDVWNQAEHVRFKVGVRRPFPQRFLVMPNVRGWCVSSHGRQACGRSGDISRGLGSSSGTRALPGAGAHD